MSDKDSQNNELYALQNIYIEEELQIKEENGHFKGQFYAQLDNIPLKVVYKDLRQDDPTVHEVAVGFLPPLVLHFSLPEDYPSNSPPNFTLSCQWLKKEKIFELCNKLDKIWEENQKMEILFLWMQFLKLESLECIGIIDTLDISDIHTDFLQYKERIKGRKYCHSGQATRRKKVAGNKQGSDSNKKDAVQANQPDLSNPWLEEKIKECDSADDSIKHFEADEKSDWKSSVDCNHEYLDDRLEQPFLKCDLRKMGPTQEDRRAIMNLSPQTSLVTMLNSYNEARQLIVFSRNVYACKVCYEEKLGKYCTRFSPCGHVFCQDCISGFLEVRIMDGNVQGISCPEDDCTSQIQASQVRDLVSAELFSRYDSVLLNGLLNSTTEVFCPRLCCQHPAFRESDDKLTTCPACLYVFCFCCKMGYHGVEPCYLDLEERYKLVDEYLEGSDEHKLEMDMKYSKKRMQLLIDITLSEEWLEGNSKRCPHCNAPIEKIDGCDKIICNQCNKFFCWKCRAQLDPKKPYDHFLTPCINLVAPERQ